MLLNVILSLLLFGHAPQLNHSQPMLQSSAFRLHGRYTLNKNNYYHFFLYMKILISGGGIAGLTLGLAARKKGHLPLILEQREAFDKPSFGGGIGLWPPSQLVMSRLGLLTQIQAKGMYMPSACYYDSEGQILGHPSPDFGSKFPVLCLEREQLLKCLYQKCLEVGVQMRTNTKLDDVRSFAGGVNANLSDGSTINAKLLVGADGIGSKVRSLILKQSGRPEVVPYHCQYAYFRAVVDVTGDLSSQWHKFAFESWGEKKRFGYVPLKSPKAFWFVAIPIGEEGLQKELGSHLCSEQQKQWILKQFRSWKGPISIRRLIEMTASNTILRTDICKVKDVTSFPWASKHSNIIILGDAANATAPNLAQGAGLAIESAWDFVSMVDFQNGRGISDYISKRKKRASTVQTIADLVAKVGQLAQPWSKTRNFVMRNATRLMNKAQQRAFEEIVRHSLGGDSQKLYWLPSYSASSKESSREEDCILGRIIGTQSFGLLPPSTKLFRSSLIGLGTGTVSVQTMPIARIFGLPPNMADSPFGAYCEKVLSKDGKQHQIWTRVFGEGHRGAVKYSTMHYETPSLGLAKCGLILAETMAARFDILRFGYLPTVEAGGISYKSKGLWLKNYKLPLPQFLLPTSEWTEMHNGQGWKFQGKIALPKILGASSIMSYRGTFEPVVCSRRVPKKHKTVIIAGGTGMIGANVARAFYLQGWRVEILSRQTGCTGGAPFAKFHRWNPSWQITQQEKDRLSQIFASADAVVNLAGENPGSSFWTPSFKAKILQSRLASIRTISSALKKIEGASMPFFIQASAAGVYGDRGQKVLVDDQNPGDEAAFRITTCKKIEETTRQQFRDAAILRIGHVFSSEGGLFPHLNLASKMGIRRLGVGNQFVPWVHVQDLADSVVHIGESRDKYSCKTINIASPGEETSESVLKKIAEARGRRDTGLGISQNFIKLVLGELSSVLLDSQRMYPQLLLQNNFVFNYALLEKAVTSRRCL